MPVGDPSAHTIPATLDVDAPPQFAPAPADCVPDRASTPHASGILTALADGSVRGVSPQAQAGLATLPGQRVTNWQAALTLRQGEVLGPDW